MAFFDFLDDVAGFISSAAAEAGKKRKPGQPGVEMPPEIPGMSQEDYQIQAFTGGAPRLGKQHGPASPNPTQDMLYEMAKNAPPSGKKPVQSNWVADMAFSLANQAKRTGKERFTQINDLNKAGGQLAKEAYQSPALAPMKEAAAPLGAGQFEAEKQEAAAKKAILEAEKSRQEVLKMQREAAGPPQQSEGLDLPNTTGAIRGPAKTAGVSPEDFDDAIGEIAKKMGLNLDEPVEFPLAFDRLLNSPDFADVRDEWGSLAAQPEAQAPGVGEMAEAGKAAQSAQQGQRVDLTGDINRKLIEVQQSKQWNWGEAIAFVLLSMLIKPAAAVMLWHRAAKTGQLDAELKSMLMEMKERAEQKKIDAEIAKERRKQAAELQKALAVEGVRQYGRSVDRKEQFRNAWKMLVFKTAMTRKKAEENPDLKIMQKDVDMHLDFAAKYAAAMDMKKAAESMQKAEQAMNFMLKYRSGELEEAAP